MRLLVTGASGFIGRHVLELLRRHGVAAWTLGRSLPGGWPSANHLSCDLLAGGDDCAQSLRQLAPSHLLHLAWVTDPASYQTTALNTDWQRATCALAQSFSQAGGRHMVVAGSCAEYDWSQGWCRENTTPLLPATPYGVAKDATRRWLQRHATERGLRLAWGRIFFPFGAWQSAHRLIPALLASLQGRRAAFPVQALQRRDFVSAADVALALWTLLQTPAHGCYNISSAQPVAIADLVRMLARLLDADPAPVLAQAVAVVQQPALVAGDNQRLRALGWSGPTPLAEGLARMVAAAVPVPSARDAAIDHGR